MTQGSGIRYDHTGALWFISFWGDDSTYPTLVDQTCQQVLGHNILPLRPFPSVSHYCTSIRMQFLRLFVRPLFTFNFFLSVTLSQCHPRGRGSHEAVLQGLLHRHPQEIGQDCRLHLWPLLSDQWETREENWWGLERHDWRGKSLFMCVCGWRWFCLSAFVSNVFSMSVPCHLRMCEHFGCEFIHILCCNKPHSIIPPPVLRRPGRPVKRYVSHQSLWELWPLNHCQQSDSCHLLHTHTHTQMRKLKRCNGG